jgi:hypothetical protein
MGRFLAGSADANQPVAPSIDPPHITDPMIHTNVDTYALIPEPAGQGGACVAAHKGNTPADGEALD